MDPMIRSYFWDRLLRGHLRGDAMTAQQKLDLQNGIAQALPDGKVSDADLALLTAAGDFAAGAYDIEEFVRYAKANKVQELDLDGFRVAQPHALDLENRPQSLEERLAALLGG